MTKSTKRKLSIVIFLLGMLCECGHKLWGFDRSAKPTFIAKWTLKETAPEFNKIPDGNPTLGLSPHISYNDTQLRIYEKSYQVALCSPGTGRYFVISADSLDKARVLYEEIAVRYTYYIAKDRTTDIYPNNAPSKGTLSDISAGYSFLWHLFRADSNRGYGTDEIHNKWHQDLLTIIFNYNEFLEYVRNFTYTSRYDYVNNNDLDGMKNYIAKVYSKETIWNNWHLIVGDQYEIGERLKQNGVGYLYYKEYFEGDEKPAPAKEFFAIPPKSSHILIDR